MDGMVNTCELSINVVKSEQAKEADRLGPKGTVVGTGSRPYPVMDTQHDRRTERTSPVPVNLVERGKPVSFLPKGR